MPYYTELTLIFAEQDIDKSVEVVTVDFAGAVNIGAAAVVAGLILAQQDVDEDVQVVTINFAVAVHVALFER